MFVISLGEVLSVVVLLAILMMWAFYQIKISFKQFFCKHDEGVNETQACDAICRKCSKNLGFIGLEANVKRRQKSNT